MAVDVSHSYSNHEINYLIHDLSSPLTAANIQLSLLSNELKNYHSQSIHLESLSYCLQSIQNLLQNYKLNIQKHNFEPQELIKTYLDNFVLPLQHQQQFQIIHEQSSNNISLYGNSTIFLRIFYNLINNSLQAIENYPLREKIITIRQESVTNQYILTICNYYRSPTKLTLDKLTQPGFTTKKGHSGLGLAYCQQQLKNEFKTKLEVSYGHNQISFKIKFNL